MDRYRIEDDPDLPEWIFATGDFEEIEDLRHVLGLWDLDPVTDADKTEHASLITFGNDRLDRWAALPADMKQDHVVEAIVRITGNSRRQRYERALAVTTPAE